jgi:hypothetical protein
VTEFKRDDPRHAVGALVEIVEILPAEASYDPESLPVIKAHRVYVNGTPVGLISRDDGISMSVDRDEDDANIVTLRLMPRQVMVRAVAETTVFDGPVDLTETEFRTFEGSAEDYGKVDDDV